MILGVAVLIQYQGVTDGRTDRQTDRQTPRRWLKRAKHYAVARNRMFHPILVFVRLHAGPSFASAGLLALTYPRNP